MKINSIKISKWHEPKEIASLLSQIYGENGLAWLDSDGNENGEWSILGIEPKEVISCNNLDENPFEKLHFRWDPGSGIPAGAPQSKIFFKNPFIFN